MPHRQRRLGSSRSTSLNLNNVEEDETDDNDVYDPKSRGKSVRRTTTLVILWVLPSLLSLSVLVRLLLLGRAGPSFSRRNTKADNGNTGQTQSGYNLLLPTTTLPSQRMFILPTTRRLDDLGPDYGGLKGVNVRFGVSHRTIGGMDHFVYNTLRLQQLEHLDATADQSDFSRSDPGRFEHYDDVNYPKATPTGCYRLKWSYERRPTCNQFHELTLDRPMEVLEQPHTVSYLARGHFRSTWLLETNENNNDDANNFVLKNIRWHPRRNYNAYTMDQVQIEALTMMLTTSSPRTGSIYGNCGTSNMMEPARPVEHYILGHDDLVDPLVIEKRNENGIVPAN
jgi:hypothetical protein